MSFDNFWIQTWKSPFLKEWNKKKKKKMRRWVIPKPSSHLRLLTHTLLRCRSHRRHPPTRSSPSRRLICRLYPHSLLSLSLFHIFQLTPSGLKRIHSFPTTFVYSNYFLPNSPFCFFFSSSNQLFFLKICQRNVRKAMNIKRYFFYLSLSFSLSHTHTYTCIDESTHTFPHTCIQHTHMTHQIFRHHWY